MLTLNTYMSYNTAMQKHQITLIEITLPTKYVIISHHAAGR